MRSVSVRWSIWATPSGEEWTVGSRPAVAHRRNYPIVSWARMGTSGRGRAIATRSADAGLDGEGRGRGSRRHVELGEDIAHVTVDGPLADPEVRGDRPIRQPGRDEPEDLDFASAEAVVRRAWSGEVACRGVEPGGVRTGAELPEHTPSLTELERGGLLVAELSQGGPDRHANASDLVRCPVLAPRCPRFPPKPHPPP